MYNSSSLLTLSNVTISGNSAVFAGGAIYNWYSDSTIHNSIIWGNTAASSPVIANGGPIAYSLIEGGYTGVGNLDVDPLFVVPVPAPGPSSGGDLRLRAGSPAINAGDNSSVITGTDQDGNPRIIAGAVDMGAYEAQFPMVIAITRAGASNPTNGASITFALAFNMPMRTAAASDFILATTGGQGGAWISAIVSHGATWDVTVTTVDNAAGTIRLDISDSDIIVTDDTRQIPLGGAGADNGSFRAGEVYTVDREAPALTLNPPGPINLANQASYPLGGSCVRSDGDVTIQIGSASGSAACAGGSFSASLNLSGLADGAGIAVLASQTDAAHNAGMASATASKDVVAPTVHMSSPATDSFSAGPITVVVSFSEAVTGFTEGDIWGTNATVGGFSGNGASYSFTLTPLAAGPLSADIAAGAAADAAGNPSSAAVRLSRNYAPDSQTEGYIYLPIVCVAAGTPTPCGP
jgi:hypothetical protein